MFKDRTSAEREYEALMARGYSQRDVNVPDDEEGLLTAFRCASGISVMEHRRRHSATRPCGAPASEAASARSLGGPWSDRTGGDDCDPRVGSIVAGPIAAALAGARAGRSPAGPIGCSSARSSPKNGLRSTMAP
jgi:hypothetical protein